MIFTFFPLFCYFLTEGGEFIHTAAWLVEISAWVEFLKNFYLLSLQKRFWSDTKLSIEVNVRSSTFSSSPRIFSASWYAEGYFYVSEKKRVLEQFFSNLIFSNFRIPIKDEMNDDYSKAMRLNERDCVELYQESCPVSFLSFLFYWEWLKLENKLRTMKIKYW